MKRNLFMETVLPGVEALQARGALPAPVGRHYKRQRRALRWNFQGLAFFGADGSTVLFVLFACRA